MAAPLAYRRWSLLLALSLCFCDTSCTLPDLSGGFQHGAAAAIGRSGGAASYSDLAKGAALASRRRGVTTYLSAKRAARREAAPRPVRAHLSQEMRALSEEMKAAAEKPPKAGFLSRISTGMYNLMPHKARSMLDRYFVGLKKLFADFSIAFRLWKGQRKLKQTQRQAPLMIEADAEKLLSWKERTLMRRIPVDFVRMLPIACNPIPPPFGLAVPLLACLFPKMLLTHQFHSEEEAAFYAWDAHSRKHGAKRDVLVQLLQNAARRDAGDELEVGTSLESSNVADERKSAVQLLTSVFEDRDGQAGIDTLPRRHLFHLLDAWMGGRAGVSRKLRLTQRVPLRYFMPSSTLRRGLKAIADEIATDDELLAACDLDSLTTDELEYACQCRGITPSPLYLGKMRKEALKRRLGAYLRVREDIEMSGIGDGERGREVQRSLILHLPALMPDHVS